VRVSAGDPCALLLWLRILSAVGNLLFLSGLAALGAARVPKPAVCAFFGLAIVAFEPSVVEFLAEFRIDGWAYALVIWSIFRFGRLPHGDYRYFELGLATGIAALLVCPKLVALPPLFVLSDQIVARERARTAVRALIGYGVGSVSALGLFTLYLTWQGIDFDRTFQILVRYNTVSNMNLRIRNGLFESIFFDKTLFVAIVAGVIGWMFDLWRRRIRPDAYLVAVAAWLVLQVLVVNYPYKQYYAPWYLLASTFLAYLCYQISTFLGSARLVVYFIVFVLTAQADFQAAKEWRQIDVVKTDQKMINWMKMVTRPDDRIVGSSPLHPIERFDSFFVWFNTFDEGGFDAERVLAQLPIYRHDVTAGRFREELEVHPPALVVLSGDWRIVPYTSGQRKALGSFLKRRNYQTVHVGSNRFALRPDRYEEARRDGFLKGKAGR
jgi:hypothetical protein